MCSRWLCGVCISALRVLSVGQFGVGLGTACAAGGFVVFVYRHCVCCVWDSLVWVWRSECGAGGFVVFVYRHCVCCLWDRLVWVWGLSVLQVALWCLYIGIVCAVCGTVWCGFDVSVQQVALWCLYIGNVWLGVEVITCFLFYEPLSFMNVYWDICNLRHHL